MYLILTMIPPNMYYPILLLSIVLIGCGVGYPLRIVLEDTLLSKTLSNNNSQYKSTFYHHTAINALFFGSSIIGLMISYFNETPDCIQFIHLSVIGAILFFSTLSIILCDMRYNENNVFWDDNGLVAMKSFLSVLMIILWHNLIVVVNHSALNIVIITSTMAIVGLDYGFYVVPFVFQRQFLKDYRDFNLFPTTPIIVAAIGLCGFGISMLSGLA